MNTVEKNSFEIFMETVNIVSYAALKISELNSETYRHFVFRIERILNEQEKVLDINESELMELGCLVLGNDGKLVVKQFFTTKVTFQISDQVDLERLKANLNFTMEQLIMDNENDKRFCFSISVENSKINIADIADYLAEKKLLNFNFFYNDESNVLTMFNNVMV